ncbi:MAG: Piwi domain-containing protein [Dysgonomonas mossii]|uniref:Piwi domain-containing protein n=1 Tax=Dysgonomonas mossii TaxID=163665 RepID=UPI003990F563
MTGLFLNFFECKLQKNNFDLQYLPYSKYSKKEDYLKLREDNPDFEFYKLDITDSNGKTDRRIYFWNKVKNPNTTIKGTKIQIEITKYPQIVSRIIEMSIIQHFRKDNRYEIFKKKQEHFWSIISPKQLIANIEGLSIRNEFNFNSSFFSYNEVPFFGFFISKNIKLDFKYDKNDFEKRNIEYRDLKRDENKIFANKQSLNRFLFATGQQGIFDQANETLEHNQEHFTSIKQVFNWLNKTKNDIILPGDNSFTEFSMKYLPLENDRFKADLLKEPLRFYFENRTERGLYDNVISKLKPYSFRLFENKTINISVICPKFSEGILEGFISKLDNYLKSIFHITVNFQPLLLNNAKLESYQNTIYEKGINNADLVIIVLNEDHIKISEISKSPYYVCKAKLIGQGIPTQDVQVKHINNLNEYVMKNIALNIYAKIGGTAWTIEKVEKRKEELVVGIGSSMNKEGKMILGIAQIFHSDGRYLVGDCSPLSTFENYAENLENYLYKSLSDVIDSTINKNNEFRLIFHLFKSASNKYEIKAVENVIKKFSDSNLTFKYAFVHLAYGHNFRLFTNDGINNEKIRVFGKEKHVNITTKGTYIELSKFQSLIHFVPESTIPLEVRLDKRSTFQDLRYISTQVYWFSHLSHRTFLPSKKTVTILYPSIMSSILEKLREINDWDKMRAEKITDKLWFI